jgi:dihydropteroate synthase
MARAPVPYNARRLPLSGPADLRRALAALGVPDPGSLASASWPDLLAVEGVDGALGQALGDAASAVGGLAAQGARGAAVVLPGGRRSALCARLRAAAGADGPALADALEALPPPPDPPTGVPAPLRIGPWSLPFGHRTYLVGILNVTPDSFSEELGRVPSAEEVLARAEELVAGGADLVDIGAESSESRDSGGLADQDELRRLLPVLEPLAAMGVPVLVDTRHGLVAREALRRGAHGINDVDAGRDPELRRAAAEVGAPVVVMHSQAEPVYADLMGDIASFLRRAVAGLKAAGLPEEQVVVDAGFGFGKTTAQDCEHTRRLGELRCLGRPIMHAPSRKRAIGRVLGFPDSIPERLPGTAAAVALGVAAGADFVRVHDLPDMARVVRMADAIVRGTVPPEA